MIDYAHALNSAQYEAATCGDGPVLVVAGAGSGKTRTITYRLSWLADHGVPPESMLLLTFTRKAAQEMLQRAAALSDHALSLVQGGTFHSFAFGVLRRYRPDWLEDRPFTVMDSADINAAVKACKDDLRLGKGDRSFPRTQAIVGFLSKARNKEMRLDEVLQREAFHLLPYAEPLMQLGEAYDAYRKEKGLLDYDDLLFELEHLLRTNERAAENLRRRYTHILVDEYQDTNLVQARIVRLLAGPEGEGMPPGNVMAVGDEAQSIYAFRGANVRNILDFPKLFPGARIIRLEENYRSTKPILDVANNLLENATESFRKKLFTRKEGGAPVRLVTPLSDMSQAKLVVRRIEDLLTRHLPHEIAVLFRAGFHSYHLEMALNQAGIAFRKYGGLRYTEAAHVKDVMAYARLLLNPLDMPAFSRVAELHEGIGPKTVLKLYNVAQSADGPALDKACARFPSFREDLRFIAEMRARPLHPVTALELIVDHYRPVLESRYPEDWPRRQQGLEEILQMASGYNDLDLFLADLALDSPDEEDEDNEGRITAVHSNMAACNRLQSEILDLILTRIGEVSTRELSIPIGSLTGSALLAGRGPRISVRMESVGSSSAWFENEFTSAGINQTNHRIVLHIDVSVAILLPGFTTATRVTNAVTVAETVIVGSVPDTYTYFSTTPSTYEDDMKDYILNNG